MHRGMTSIRTAAAAVAFALLVGLPAGAAEIKMRCQNELETKPSLWVFDTANLNGFFEDGRMREARIQFAGNQITVRQTNEQPVCHIGTGCTSGKTVTEFTTVINRSASNYLVYCKNIQDDGGNWKPGQNCFPKGPNKGTCLKE